MKLHTTLAIAAAMAAAATAAQASSSVQGDWLTQSGSAKVHVGPCGDRLCGAIVWMRNPLDKATGRPQLDVNNPDPALRSRPIVGLQLIKGFKPSSGGRWTGGSIYDPQSGKTYDSKLSLNPDGTLKVEGCISIICQAQTWKPAP